MDYYGYNHYGSDFVEILTMFIGFFMVIMAIGAIAMLAQYIFRGISCMELAKRHGLANPWLAWIPVAGLFTLGAIADDISARQGRKSYFRYMLLAGSILLFLLNTGYYISMGGFLQDLPYYFQGGYDYYDYPSISMMYGTQLVSVFLTPVSIAYIIVMSMALYRIYKTYHPQNAVIYLVLGIFFAILQPIFLFTIRKRPPANREPATLTQRRF